MLSSKYDNQYWDDDSDGDLDPNEDDSWDSFSEDDDIPEKIEWLEEVDNDDLEEYSFEDDYDEADLDDD